MRVQNNSHPYGVPQPKSPAKQSAFAEMLAGQTAASTSVAPEKETPLFSDPAIVSGLQAVKPVAANYPAELTAEQIEALNSKYDIGHLKWPSRDSIALGEELFSLGVIDDDQRKFFYGAVKYTEHHLPIGILTPAGEAPARQMHYTSQPGDSMLDIILNELAVQQQNLDFLLSPDTPEKRSQLPDDGIPLENHIAHLERYMGQYQRVYDILARDCWVN
jgi:hypothetical protein